MRMMLSDWEKKEKKKNNDIYHYYYYYFSVVCKLTCIHMNTKHDFDNYKPIEYIPSNILFLNPEKL